MERIVGKEEKLVCQVETFMLGSPWMQKVFHEVRDWWVQSLLWLNLLLPHARECPDDHNLCTGILSRSPVREFLRLGSALLQVSAPAFGLTD